MTRTVTRELFDPRRGDPSIRLRDWQIEGESSEPARTNYFAIYWATSGSGHLFADSCRHIYGPESLLFFAPYQYIRFVPNQRTCGQVIEFHANFLCVETFHAQVGCSSILFNDRSGGPVVAAGHEFNLQVADFAMCIRQELARRELAFVDVTLAYLKVLLILATRIKTSASGPNSLSAVDARHPQITALRELIEQNYQTWRSPSDYAKALHTTAKSLGRTVREQLSTTLTDLVRDRVLTHAKWDLLHTLKPVKQVARELGFRDELYFSRLFKKATGVSPTFFREFETEIRNGSNLSMPSSHAPIP